jgi:NAD(P) transhydrogenase subunit alpha
MKVGIPKEIFPLECRVAATPDTVEKMVKLGLEVVVEAGAGDASSFADAAYIEAGARIADASAVFAASDIVLKVRQPIARPAGGHEADLIKSGAILISFIWPAQNKALVDRLAARKVTVFAMDAVPRITRAQKEDALSAMANIAGYRAVVEAAHHFGRFFSGQVTAAGRVKPAQVLVLGAGVAGLAAIAAAKGLGAVVKAFDTRPVVREQVESLGAQFIEFKFEEAGEGAGGYAKQMSDAYLAAEQALIAKHAAQSDIIISTALIPGKPAPVLITPGAVTAMAQGSVIVDMAAEQGGNCPLTEKDKVVAKSGVTLVGLTDLPSRMARQSSELYATTVLNLLKEMYTAEKGLAIDLKDEIQRGAIILKDGELLWPAPAAAPAPAPAPKAAPAGNHGAAAAPANGKKSSGSANIVAALAAILLGAAAIFGPPEFIQHLTVFLLACVVGWHVIWNVTPALHTPLMSVTNAISGIIVIGGMLALYGGGAGALALGGVAVLLAAINVAGGFLVTQRMLKMFRK